ncbi:DUF2505 domain-containing protein [Solimonas soli]|uniref:DUF2505 domain-containing protein n=1 Tax=Solimonas soli TaxID=413479 RepID=UPI0004818D57|nr:DUF2505 domain-containing protein [Solimonas soli]
MKHEQKQTFEKPAATVIRMFGDRRYFERKYELLGFKNVEVLEHRLAGDDFSIRIRYTTAASVPLPDFARKFISGDITIVQEDRWNLARRVGRLEVDLRGLPVKVAADMKLGEHGKGGAANTLSWDVRCTIPLIGGKLEKLLVADIEAKADADLAASRRILADY